MTDTVRFPAQLPYDKWAAVSNVFGLMNQPTPDWNAVRLAYETQKGAVDDSIGAGNYWRGQYNPGGAVVPTTPPSIDNNSVPLPWFSSPKDQINATVSNGAGGATAACGSGGDLVWVSTDPSFPPIEGVTASSVGFAGPIAVAAGQTFYFKQTTAATQSMRASVAA